MRQATISNASSCLAAIVFIACTAAGSRASDRPAIQPAPTTRPAASDDRDLRPDRVFIGVTPREPGQQDGPIVHYPFDYGRCGPYPDDYETYCEAGPYFRTYGIYSRGGCGAYAHDCKASYGYRLAPRRLGYRSFYSPAARPRGSRATIHRHR